MPFVLLAIFIFSMGYLFEITTTDHTTALLAARIQYIGIPFIAPLLFLFTLEFCGVVLKKQLVIPVLAVPLGMLLLMQSFRMHTLFYREVPQLDAAGLLAHLAVSGGILYYIFYFLLYILTIASTFVVLRFYKQGDHLFKRQCGVLLMASLVPFIGHALKTFGWRFFDLDPMPIFFIAPCLLIAYHTFMLDMYRIAPIVRDEIVESMGDGFILLNMQDRFIDSNLAAQKLLPSIIGISPGRKMCEVEDIPWITANQNADKFEFCKEDSAGNRKYYRLSETLIHFRGKDVGRSIMIYDITDSRLLLDKISMIAERDGLTGIYNRQAFQAAAEKILQKVNQDKDRAWLMMLDLDHFKEINDQYGHLKGDTVLKGVADTITAHLRKDDLFARYGGEEFCVLLPKVSQTNVWRIAEVLREHVEQAVFKNDDNTFNITISIGIAGYDSARHTTLESLLVDADSALYAAKNAGRNRVALFQQE